MQRVGALANRKSQWTQLGTQQRALESIDLLGMQSETLQAAGAIARVFSSLASSSDLADAETLASLFALRNMGSVHVP